MKKFFAITAITLSLIAFAAIAGGNELAYYKLQNLPTLTNTSVTSSDFVGVYDASAGKVRKVVATPLATTSTAAELNILDGVTSTAAELNYLDLTTLGTGAASKAVVLDAGDDYVWPAAGILTYGVLKDGAGTTLGATVAELNLAADISAAFEDVTATNVLTTAECGKTMTLNSATEFASTLPAPTAGCKFKFVIKAAPSGAAYTILTNAGADIIVIGVNELEVDTTNDGVYDVNADTVTFADGVAVEGDFVDCNTDGTKWYCDGQTNADGGITTSTT